MQNTRHLNQDEQARPGDGIIDEANRGTQENFDESFQNDESTLLEEEDDEDELNEDDFDIDEDDEEEEEEEDTL